jgi:hypothetical protein
MHLAIISRLDWQARLPVSDARSAKLRGWGREALANTILEQDRAVCLWNTLMHQRAIAVAFDVCCKALMWLVPGHLTHIVTGGQPTVEALEVFPYIQSNIVAHHVHDSIPQARFVVEIYWIV